MADSSMPNLIDPGYASQQMQIQNQQAMAQALIQASLTPKEGQMVSGHYIAPAFGGLSNIAQAYMGKKMRDDNYKAMDALNASYSQKLAAALGGGQPQQPQPLQTQGDMSQPSVAPSAISSPHTLQQQNPTQPTPQALGGALNSQGGTPFNFGNLIQGKAIETVGGDNAAKAYWNRYDPTELEKQLRFAGIDPNSQQGKMIIMQKLTPPIAMREGDLVKQNVDGSYTSAFQAPKMANGIVPQRDENGQVIGATDIPNYAAANARIEGSQTGAQEGAKSPFVQPSVIQTPSGPRLATAPQANAYATGGNNNFGNMRPNGASTGFQQFASPQEGLAAIDKNLQSYGNQGVNTLSGIISKWAPPSENNTQAYISDVAKRLGIDPNQPLDMANPAVRQAIGTGIMIHEQGSSKLFGGQNQMPGAPLITPQEEDVNKAKGAASVESAKIQAAADPLLAQITDARKLVNSLPYGATTGAEDWAANQKYLVGNPQKAAAIAQWEKIMGNFTMNGIASSGLGRMDIPIVNAINKASQVGLEDSPAAKNAALDTIEASLKRHVASSANLVSNLNMPDITKGTVQHAMPAVGNPNMASMQSAAQAEIARRAQLRGGK